MSAELWLGLVHYLIGIVAVLGLLVVLMETSRKFDRHHDGPHLLLSVGYFLLLVWAILKAMSLSVGPLLNAAAVFQLLGWLMVAIGYYRLHHEQIDEEVEPSAVDSSPVPSKDSRPLPAWIKLLADERETTATKPDNIATAGEGATNSIEQTDPTDSVEPLVERAAASSVEEDHILPGAITDQSASEHKPKVKRVAKTISDGEVDLSYLAAKRKPKAVNPIQSIGDSTEEAPANSQAEGLNVDTSTIPPSPEKRDELMDELFPMEKGEKVDDKVKSKKTAKVRKVKPPVVLAGLLATSGDLSSWFNYWPEVSTIILLIIIIILLLPSRRVRGNGWLIGALTLHLLGQTTQLFINPILDGVLSAGVGWKVMLGEVIIMLGAVLLGIAGWSKIKGKVTHHFIRIVAIVYAVMLMLTLGLTFVIVKDQTTLQLMIVMMTGVLITILPIIHSLTYSHPHQPVSDSSGQ